MPESKDGGLLNGRIWQSLGSKPEAHFLPCDLCLPVKAPIVSQDQFPAEAFFELLALDFEREAYLLTESSGGGYPGKLLIGKI